MTENKLDADMIRKLTAPTDLLMERHWVLRKGDTGKEPYGKEGASAWQQPRNWYTFRDVIDIWAANPSGYDGIGFVVAYEPDLGSMQVVGGDLDNCRDPVSGWVSPWAENFLKGLNAVTAVSISGCGFRFFCLGTLPKDMGQISGNGPADDITPEAAEHMIAAKPKIKEKLDKGQLAWNGFEVYVHKKRTANDKPGDELTGVKHLTVTGIWLPQFPQELEDRTTYLHDVFGGYAEDEYGPHKTEKSRQKKGSLPALDILKVIDTIGFKRVGSELVGANPIFGSTTGTNLHVNPFTGIWHDFNPSRDCGGDAWLWLACECGAIRWDRCGGGSLHDRKAIVKTFEHAITRGLFTEAELFPERVKVNEAIKYINDSSAIVLSNPSCVLVDEKIIENLAIIKQNNENEYIKIKSMLRNAGVKLRDMEKLIDNKIEKDRPDPASAQMGEEDGYITWTEFGPVIRFTDLVQDIIKDMHVRVIVGSKKDIAMYKEAVGTYEIGDAVTRKLKAELNKRIRESGDYNLATLTMQVYSKFDLVVTTDSPEIGELEQYPHLLCCGNGVVDLRTSKLMPYSPDYYMVEKTSHNYNPDKPWHEQAPTWNRCLNTTFDGDLERIQFFQKAMGYCATGETRSDDIFLLYGVGGTGKSTIIDSLRNALSNSSLASGYVRALKADLQNSKSGGSSIRDGIARAKYARMLLIKELDENNDVSWSTLKEMCSTSSVIEARQLFGGTQNFKLKCKLVFDTNHLPKCENPDRSVTRRLKIIPFRHIFRDSEKDEETFTKLQAEADGILAWVIEGARKYYEEGLGSPQFIADGISSYKTEMDENLAGAWVDQWEYEVNTLVDSQSPELWIPVDELYMAYRNFIHGKGVVPLGQMALNKLIVKNTGAKKQQMTKNTVRDTYWLNLMKKAT